MTVGFSAHLESGHEIGVAFEDGARRLPCLRCSEDSLAWPLHVRFAGDDAGCRRLEKGQLATLKKRVTRPLASVYGQRRESRSSCL